MASAISLTSFLLLILLKGNLPPTTMFMYVGLLGATIGGLLYLGIDATITLKEQRSGDNIRLIRSSNGRVIAIGNGGGNYVIRRLHRRGEVKLGRPNQLKDKRILKWMKITLITFLLLEAYLIIVFISGTFTPIMVIPSQSMAPTLNRGDLVFIVGVDAKTINVGDIIVFNVPPPYNKYTPSPVIHRVIKVEVKGGEIFFKTKGDNNPSADAWEVPAGNVIGKLNGKIPYIGFPILFLKTPYGLAVAALLLLTWIFRPQLRKASREGGSE